MVASFAAIVLLCGFFAADALSLLVDYHRLTPPEKLSDTADSAPPQREYEHGPRRLARNASTDPTASPSPSPDGQEETDAAGAGDSEQVAMIVPADAEESFPPVVPADSYPVASASQANDNHEIALQGILKGASTGVAVVEYQGDTLTVSPGDTIGSYRVTDIQSDRVLLDKNGEPSQIRIATPHEGAGSTAPAPTVGNYPPVLPAPNQVPLPPQPVTLPSISYNNGAAAKSSSGSSDAVYNITEADLQDNPGVTPPADELSREELEEFTRKGAALMADIRGTEVENGRGVQVKFRNPDNALAKLGMKDGDIVMRINSKSVYGVEDIYNAVLTMRDAPQIDIEVNRNGQPVSLFHKFPERYE